MESFTNNVQPMLESLPEDRESNGGPRSTNALRLERIARTVWPAVTRRSVICKRADAGEPRQTRGEQAIAIAHPAARHAQGASVYRSRADAISSAQTWSPGRRQPQKRPPGPRWKNAVRRRCRPSRARTNPCCQNRSKVDPSRSRPRRSRLPWPHCRAIPPPRTAKTRFQTRWVRMASDLRPACR